MKEIKILGTGCAKCKATMEVISKVAKEQGFDGKIEKVEDITAIISYGVMSTPAVVIDGKVAFAGGVPTQEQTENWFNSSSDRGDCCK